MIQANITTAFTVLLGVQFLHSLEELSTGFHKRWYLFTMPFWVFLLWEILFQGFWVSVLLVEEFPHREWLMQFFILLMVANAIQHFIWAAKEKRYVPGLYTAPLFLIVFLWFNILAL